jgi:transcriptional regulator with XRE-family HTH domain
MIVGDRLKAIREMKNLSQGDIEKRTGLLRCYTSRVENGHTVPSVETLEKYARALEVPLYQIFFDSQDRKPEELELPKNAATKVSKKDASVVARLSQLVSRMDARDKKLLVGFAQKLAAR